VFSSVWALLWIAFEEVTFSLSIQMEGQSACRRDDRTGSFPLDSAWYWNNVRGVLSIQL